jgi:hypothetical protein
MALALDPTVLDSIVPTADGVSVPLTKAQRAVNVFYKFESTDQSISDTQHEDPWRDEIVADIPFGRSRKPRIGIGPSETDLRSAGTEDGLIIGLEGHPAGIYGYVDGRFIAEDETEEWENNTGQEAARAQRWGFQVSYILKTNGPELRDRSFRTDEQRKEEEQANMFSVIAAAFSQGATKLQGQGEMNPKPSDILAAVDLDALQAEMDRRKGSGKTKP